MAHSRCLVFIGAADLDFLDGARCAVDEIPKAELLLLAESDHYAAHMSPGRGRARGGCESYARADLVAALGKFSNTLRAAARTRRHRRARGSDELHG
jgi:hypothetical protein